MLSLRELEAKYASEWAPKGEYISSWGLGAEPKRNYPINEKENFLRVLNGKPTMYLPCMTDMLPLSPRVIVDNVVRAFSMDAKPCLMNAAEAGGEDMFGVVWDFIPVTGGAMVRPGKPKIPDITKWEEYLTFPNLDELDWEGSASSNAPLISPDRLTRTWIMNGLNERIISFMDFDKVMIAYVDEDQKEGVHRLFDALCVFYDDLIGRFKKYLKTDIIMFNDDWGTQRSPQFSNATAREMLVPYIKRLVESCHKRDMYFELHSCGKNDMLVPVFIEAGIDIWAPQEIINDFDLLYRTAAGDILLGIPTDSTPAMSDEEAFDCALNFFEKYGRGGKVMLNTTFPVQHPRIAEFIYYISREAYAQS